METTGNTTVNTESLERILYLADESLKRVRDIKEKGGTFSDYDGELSYYLGMKNALEILGLVEKKDFDFLELK